MNRRRVLVLAAVITVTAAIVPLAQLARSGVSGTGDRGPAVTPRRPPSAAEVSGSAPFTMLTELYGDGTALAERRLDGRLANGLVLHPPLTGAAKDLLTAGKPPLAYFAIPSEAGVGSCYPASDDPAADETLRGLTRTIGPSVWRLGMPEFDQSGGCWANRRPRAAGQSDADAYAAWTGFYRDTLGLKGYLDQSADQRGYAWMSVCVNAFCPQYAYDMGSDAVLLERNTDEVSGMNPGLAMVRGAARQHGDRRWGVDLSTWRYWNNGETVFDGSGRLVTGWSPATFTRSMYAGYMAGADVLQNEAAVYEADGGLNPLGEAVRAFGDFSLDRHPNRGSPYVPMAIMQDHASGFEPKFGEYGQGQRKWYQQNPYTAGDRMLAGLLDVAYPGYAAWGTVPADAPWRVTAADGSVDVGKTRAAYRAALAGGAEPRRWEPMGATRWGETLDVITDQATLPALQRYRVVTLATGGPISAGLLDLLGQYARGGGTVVVTAGQLPDGAEGLTGLHVTGGKDSADAAVWAADGRTVDEGRYDYRVASPSTATVVAATPSGAPVITRNAVGSGAVYVATADYLRTDDGHLLNVGKHLLDDLQSRDAKVTVSGPPLQYLVNTDGGRTIVTLVNTDVKGAAWTGTLSFPAPAGGRTAVAEWTGDTTANGTVRDGRLTVDVTVPPYDVRVFAVDGG